MHLPNQVKQITITDYNKCSIIFVIIMPGVSFEVAVAAAAAAFTIFILLSCILVITHHENDVYNKQSKKYASRLR